MAHFLTRNTQRCWIAFVRQLLTASKDKQWEYKTGAETGNLGTLTLVKGRVRGGGRRLRDNKAALYHSSACSNLRYHHLSLTNAAAALSPRANQTLPQGHPRRNRPSWSSRYGKQNKMNVAVFFFFLPPLPSSFLVCGGQTCWQMWAIFL